MPLTRRVLILGGAALAAIGLGWLAFLGLRAFLVDQAGSDLVDGNYEQAVSELRWAAYMGDSTAQGTLGLLYAFGVGVPKNDNEAIAWMRRAGPDGEATPDPAAPAMYAIGMSYLQGHAFAKPDPAEALKWLSRSAQGGYEKAAQQLKIMQSPLRGSATRTPSIPPPIH
jgi:TPR repeat protein